MCRSRYWCHLNGSLLAVGGDEIEEYTVKEEMMEIIDLDCAFVMMCACAFDVGP